MHKSLTPQDKKLERMQRNREAADLSRRRRRERLHILEVFSNRLCQENDMLKRRAIELSRLNPGLHSAPSIVMHPSNNLTYLM